MVVVSITRVSFVHTETVRFRDLDSMGHMNNAVYATFLEQARLAFLSQHGAHVHNMILARLEIDFRSPVEFRRDDRDRRHARRASGRRASTSSTSLRAAERVVGRGEDRARGLRLRRGPLGGDPRRMEGATGRLMPAFERTTLDNGLRLLTASMPQVASTTCFIFLAAGLALRDARDERHRALRRAHVLQGNRAPPDRA
jgi:acyl-CoA thioester hydrolase